MTDKNHQSKKVETTEIPPEKVVEYFDTFEFRSLPLEPKKPAELTASKIWRVVLISLVSRHEPLALEISDDIIIGRSLNKPEVDLDLTAFNALELGVSRVHALLRPTETTLYLFDQKSTNGTYCNALKATPEEPVKVKDNDILSFGALKFLIKIVRHPQDTK